MYFGDVNFKGEPEGQGMKLVPQQAIYEGRWAQNTLNGYGRVIYANGDSYIGEFVRGLKSGFGTLKMANGYVY